MPGDGRFSVIHTNIDIIALFFFLSVIERTKKEMGFPPFIIMSLGSSSDSYRFHIQRKRTLRTSLFRS